MSALPHQTSISPLSISQGTANSFFLPAGGVVPPPPPPSTISSISDILVSSISFGQTQGSFPTGGMTLYKGNAAVGGGASSTIIATYEGSVGFGSVSVDSLSLLTNTTTVDSFISQSAQVLTINGEMFCDTAGTFTVSSVTTSFVNGVAYVPQPVTRFGQSVLDAGGSTIVAIPPYSGVYAVGLGGAQSTLVRSRQPSSFTVFGPVGSNFSWMTVASTQ